MLTQILIDAGPIIALFDKDDSYHEKIKDKGFRFVTTTAVVTEVSHMLDFNVNVQIQFLEWIENDGILNSHQIVARQFWAIQYLGVPRFLAVAS
jgi:predicted nucleic acid-binding protein